MELSGMTQKWSSRPKSDKAARIRGNQQRHRARTKAYIADLEKQLADTQSRLCEVLRRNAELVSELENVRATCPNESIISCPDEVLDDAAPLPPAGINAPSTPTYTSIPCNDELPSVMLLENAQVSERTLSGLGEIQTAHPSVTPRNEKGSSSSLTKPLKRAQPPESLKATESPKASGTNTNNTWLCSGSTPARSSRMEANMTLLLSELSDCAHLPPPAPGESTILCKVAYDLIEQQNYIGLGLHDIRMFLDPGFRRATIQGDGCRVKSNLVFAVIDAISSS